MGNFYDVTLDNPTAVNNVVTFSIYNMLSPPTLEPADSLTLAITETTLNTKVQTGAFSIAATFPNNLQLLTATTTNIIG